MRDHNENRPGYKKTKVGWIPEEWKCDQVRATGKVVTGTTPATSNSDFYGGEYLFVTPVDIGISPWIRKSSTTLSRKGFKKARKIDRGSVMFVCIGSTIGKVGIAEVKLSINQQINAIVPNSKSSGSYLYYVLLAQGCRIALYAGCQAVPIINKSQFETVRISLPPLSEQRKIAEILSTWDKAIEQTRRLIDAKKHRKKALMQQLLTGKKRLPGFSEEWKVYRLSSLLSQVSRPVEFDDNALYNLISVRRRSEGIFRRGEVIGHSIKTKQMYKARNGDFLISKMQIVHGASALVSQEFDGMHISGSYISLQGTNPKNINDIFLNWFSKTPYFYHLTYLASYGVHIEKMTFNLRLFLKAKITIPKNVEEQHRIADVLATADDDIKILEQKLSALEKQKRGLMQKLLAGEVRVAP